MSARTEKSSAEIAFSIFVAAGLFLFFSTIVELILALVERRKGSRGWRALFALSVADAVLGLLVTGAFAAHSLRTHDQLFIRTEKRPPMIGVYRDESRASDGEGAEIGWVLPDSPAGRAGVLPGDSVKSVGGRPVADFDDLRTIVAATTPSTAIDLVLVRDGERMTVSVVPGEIADTEGNRAIMSAIDSEARTGRSKGRSRALFERTGTCKSSDLDMRGAGIVPLVVLVTLFATFAVFKKERTRAIGWAIALAAILSGDLVSLALFEGSCAGFGGRTIGGAVLAVAFGTLARGVVGATAWSRLQKKGLLEVSVPPPIGLRRAYARSLLYALGFSIRVVVAGYAIMSLIGIASGQTYNIARFPADADWPLVARVILGITIVILGPIAEEIIFRGVLLPIVAKNAGATRAAIETSLVFAVGHYSTHGPWIALPFAYGLVASWARLRTGGLWASIALHMTINAIAIGWALLKAS